MMRKSLIALGIAAASGGAAADTLLGLYVGGGTWQASYDGSAGVDAADIDELNLDDSDNLFFYAALEHPVPVIPNIRLARSNVQVDGVSQLQTDFRLDDETFTVGTDVYTDLDLTHTDVTLYYELLDNWISFDLGVTARVFDGYAYVEERQEDGSQGRFEEVDLSEVIPLGYAKVQADFPMSGWRVAASGNYISYSGDSFSDLDAKIGYMTDGLMLDFGLDLGYRRMDLDISDAGDLEADVTIDGPYLEISVHF